MTEYARKFHLDKSELKTPCEYTKRTRPSLCTVPGHWASESVHAPDAAVFAAVKRMQQGVFVEDDVVQAVREAGLVEGAEELVDVLLRKYRRRKVGDSDAHMVEVENARAGSFRWNGPTEGR